MSGYEIAAIIIALALAGLIAFVIIKLNPILGKLNHTVGQVNDTLSIVTRDVDNLSIEVEGLLNKTNTLVDDLNGKIGKTDPLFKAIGDLGTTVSDVNTSTRNFAAKVSAKQPSKAVSALKVGQALISKGKKKK